MRIFTATRRSKVILIALTGIACCMLVTSEGYAAAASAARPAVFVSVGDTHVPVQKASFAELPATQAAAPPDMQGEHFVSGTTGYGATTDGQIVKTTNAGRTWTRIAMDPDASFGSMTWTGQVGVADGLYLYGGTAVTLPTLAITTDNGGHWRFLHPRFSGSLASPPITSPTLTAAQAISAKDIILLPPAANQNAEVIAKWLPVSTDGGQSFHPVPLPRNWEPTGGFVALSAEAALLTMTNTQTGASGVAQFSVQRGFTHIVAARLPVELYAAMRSQNGTLYVAGGTFAKFTSPVADALYAVNLAGNGHFTLVSEIRSQMGMAYAPIVDLQSANGATFYALEGGLTMGANNPDSGTLLISRNSGKSWMTTRVTGSTISVISKKIWLWASQGPWNNPQYPPTNLVSVDGGLRFHSLPVQTNEQWAWWAQFGKRSRRASVPNLYVQTTTGLLQSASEGASWSKSPMPLTAADDTNDTYTYLDLQSSPSFRILTTFQSTSLATSLNQGESWQSMRLPANVELIDGVSGTPKGTTVMIGHSPRGWDNVYLTDNKGRLWTTVPSPFGQMDGMSVALVSSKVGYAAPEMSEMNPVAAYPYLWQTIDGGKTWHKLDLASWSWIPVPYQLPAPLMAVRHTLLFAGLWTPNGSTTAQPILLFYPPGGVGARAVDLGDHIPVSISFSSMRRGVMVTGNGGLYLTDDGGLTWKAIAV